jgi:uncharacterized membrane protein
LLICKVRTRVELPLLANGTSTIYGIRQISAKHNARPNLKAGARILLAALGAAIPTVGLIQLDGAGVGVVNLIVGGILCLLVYLTLIPILGLWIGRIYSSPK